MRFWLTILALAFGGTAAAQGFEYRDYSDEERIVILVFGDSGTGEAGQYRVSRAMYEVCRQRGCHFAITLGDNFYDNGIRVSSRYSASESYAEILDQFEEKFEAPYQRFESFDGFVFWVVLGNHDYRRNTIATYMTYSAFSDLWRFPSFHYLVPGLPDWLRIYGLHTDTDVRRDLNGLQIQAARRVLCDDRDDRWKLAFGHHPVYNSGHHRGDSNERRTRALLEQPLIQDCGVHVYLAGHAHHQEHLTATGFEQVIQGSAAKSKGSNRTPGYVGVTQRHFAREYGFGILEIDEETLRMEFYDVFDTTESGVLEPLGPEDIFMSYTWCGTRADIGQPYAADRPCR